MKELIKNILPTTVDNFYKINTMTLEQKLLEELNRYKAINRYGKKMIMEQDVPPPPGADTPPPPPGGVPAPPVADPSVPPTDTQTPPAGEETPTPESLPPSDDETEEVDVTDLVNMTKNIKKEMDSNKQNNDAVVSKMDDVFSKLNDLETKLSSMDSLLSKIDQLGQKVETMKEPTAVEKLEMRSLDSYPFSQNPQQFFAQKQDQMRQSGKNEYVLTKDEIENYSKDSMRDSFNPTPSTDEFSI